MDLLLQTDYLLKKTGLKPDKLKGQNFCVDEKVISQMVEAAQVDHDDEILEIGPGFGFLTLALLKRAKKVTAVELEKKFITPLKNLQRLHHNFRLIEGDILRVNDDQLPGGNYKIVANLPYSITSVFLKKFLTSGHQPLSMTLLTQKEVALRICARPGAMSRLALAVQLYGRPRLVDFVQASSFWPRPAVDSAILQITDLHGYSYQNQAAEKIYWQIVRSGFAAKRKQLKNNLKNSLHLKAAEADKMLQTAGLNAQSRAQELSPADWLKLAQAYQATLIDV